MFPCILVLRFRAITGDKWDMLRSQDAQELAQEVHRLTRYVIVVDFVLTMLICVGRWIGPEPA